MRSRPCTTTDLHDPELQLEVAGLIIQSLPKQRKNNLKVSNTIQTILDTLASENRDGETSLVFKIEPELIEEAMNVLRDRRKLFAPVILGVTDTGPIYESYERMRQAEETGQFILLLVECQSEQQLRDALIALPIRHSSEWRHLDRGGDF